MKGYHNVGVLQQVLFSHYYYGVYNDYLALIPDPLMPLAQVAIVRLLYRSTLTSRYGGIANNPRRRSINRHDPQKSFIAVKIVYMNKDGRFKPAFQSH